MTRKAAVIDVMLKKSKFEIDDLPFLSLINVYQ